MKFMRRQCSPACSVPLNLWHLFLALIIAGGLWLAAGEAVAQTNDRSVEPAPPTAGNVPGGHLGNQSDSEFWRAIRQGEQGTVSIPDKQAGRMIQSEGDNWRAIRNGPVTVAGAWIILGMIALLALFFLLRGRIKIDDGPSGRIVIRFNGLERFAHWLTASSFIVLALTGLNILYGRNVLLPILGPDIFAAITLAGKYAHNYLAFAFMVGIALMFVLWVWHNFPNKYDLEWIALGGGMVSKGTHPPAKKFNAGQKLIFWAVILGGVSLSLSGLALMFPFQFGWFNPTFEVLNSIGFNLADRSNADARDAAFPSVARRRRIGLDCHHLGPHLHRIRRHGRRIRRHGHWAGR